MNLVVLPPKRMGAIRFGRTTSGGWYSKTDVEIINEFIRLQINLVSGFLCLNSAPKLDYGREGKARENTR